MLTVRVGRPLLNSCFALWLFLVSACSSHGAASNSGAGGAELASGEVSCTTDPRVDSYAAGLEKAGRLGVFSFRLDDSAPAPPAKGANTFVLQVVDASGASADVALSVDLKMPDHGHGTSIVPTVSFDPDAQSFTIAPLYLFMPGVWRIDFTARGSGTEAASDSAEFFFCIEG